MKKQLINGLRKQGFPEKILYAIEKVKREDFVPSEFKELAYADEALPIGLGQTISQPFTITFMLNLLELGDNMRILEVGSGSGYVLALMDEISKNSKIFGVEIVEILVNKSRKVLKDKKNIVVVHRNGIDGLKEEAPFNRILVSASSNEIPQRLINQLEYNGIMVCVVKESIVVVKKLYGENQITEYPGFVFVPLVDGEDKA